MLPCGAALTCDDDDVTVEEQNSTFYFQTKKVLRVLSSGKVKINH